MFYVKNGLALIWDGRDAPEKRKIKSNHRKKIKKGQVGFKVVQSNCSVAHLDKIIYFAVVYLLMISLQCRNAMWVPWKPSVFPAPVVCLYKRLILAQKGVRLWTARSIPACLSAHFCSAACIKLFFRCVCTPLESGYLSFFLCVCVYACVCACACGVKSLLFAVAGNLVGGRVLVVDYLPNILMISSPGEKILEWEVVDGAVMWEGRGHVGMSFRLEFRSQCAQMGC